VKGKNSKHPSDNRVAKKGWVLLFHKIGHYKVNYPKKSDSYEFVGVLVVSVIHKRAKS